MPSIRPSGQRLYLHPTDCSGLRATPLLTHRYCCERMEGQVVKLPNRRLTTSDAFAVTATCVFFNPISFPKLSRLPLGDGAEGLHAFWFNRQQLHLLVSTTVPCLHRRTILTTSGNILALYLGLAFSFGKKNCSDQADPTPGIQHQFPNY